MFGHFLQSHEWEKYEKLEGEKTFWREGEGFHSLVLLKTTPIGNYLYVPYGPALKSVEYFEDTINDLKELAEEQNAFFIRVEPTFPVVDKIDSKTDRDDGVVVDKNAVILISMMKRLGLKKSHDIDPAVTWVVDLPETEDELRKIVHRKRFRDWRNAEKVGLKFRTSKDPEEIVILSSLLEKMSKERHFNPQDENHLKNQLKAGFATLYVAELEGKPVAASLLYDYNDTRFAVHAADDPEYHSLYPGVRLTIQKMVDAQRAGKKYYDFWGITTSNNPKHPWYGFTKYKKSYAGRQVDYAGTWDLPMDKLKYAFYSVLRKINRLKRKV